ncbi:hypothetical protein LDL08_33985 [Nonomuraea glycinis]|jgi:hypothetical protein|uniref:Lipoprotein n=1 Tax=Nonomuraea glycinis TaxID=2047744 RepID=A0A918AAE6_9ACTN|nr:hypothetical protein [Nonomuraea glycinis]MCA2181194.1 hypothetical protein [Nonomuraea glycinis]WSG69622.1 hypothetical protein OHA68_09340 [Nonomuraea glycinis]GGP13469.1 hypothetical protein GCM10012278_65360 [Nonomuraea glycinis]
MIRKAAVRALLAIVATLPLGACGATPAQMGGGAAVREQEGQGSLADPRVLTCANRNGFVEEDENTLLASISPEDFVEGPLVIPGLLAWGTARPEEYGSGNHFKVGAVVRKGGKVTLSIPEEFHESAGLLYAEAARTATDPAGADHSVTFVACDDHDTLFVGGFHVLAPRCVPFDIAVPGRPVVRKKISFFDGKC